MLTTLILSLKTLKLPTNEATEFEHFLNVAEFL